MVKGTRREAPAAKCEAKAPTTRSLARAARRRSVFTTPGPGALLWTVLAALLLGPAYDAWSFVKIFHLRAAYPSAGAPAKCVPTTQPTVDTGLLGDYPPPESTPWHALAVTGPDAAKEDLRAEHITIVTLCTSAMGHLCAASIDNKRAYAQRHGYKLFVAPDSLVDPTRPVAWSKLRAMETAMEAGAHLVAWFDADALIMAPAVRLEDIHGAVGGTGTAQVVASDHRGPNTGVWLMRSGPWSASFLQRMQALGDTYVSMRPGQSLFRYEQRAFHYLFQTAVWRATMAGRLHVHGDANGVRAGTALVHPCVMNSLPSWYQPGEFVLHLAGVKGTARCLLFRRAYSAASAAAGRVPGRGDVARGPSLWHCLQATSRWPLSV